MSGGRRAAAGRPPSLHTRPCLAQSATGSLPRRRGATARVPYHGAAAASYAPGGQPARLTCHRDPARPARSASTPRGPPRYSAGCRGYPASVARRGRDRAVDRCVADPTRRRQPLAQPDDSGKGIDDDEPVGRRLGNQQPAIIGAQINGGIGSPVTRPRGRKAPLLCRGRNGRSLAPIARSGAGMLAHITAGRAGTLRRWAALLHHAVLASSASPTPHGAGTCLHA